MAITGPGDFLHRLDTWRRAATCRARCGAPPPPPPRWRRPPPSPMASTSPNSESVLMENPSKGKTMKVPISETGTASSGISVALQPLQEDVNHENDQDHGFAEGLVNLVDSFADCQRGVERNDRSPAPEEIVLSPRPSFEDAVAGRQGIAAGSEVKRDQGRRLGGLSWFSLFRRCSQPRDIRIVLRSHFHPRHVLQAQDGAIGLGANDDLIELLRRRQSSGARTL